MDGMSCRRNTRLSPWTGSVVVSVVVLFLLSSLAVRDVAATELYSFQSHQLLQRGDEETASVSLAMPLAFLQRNYSGVTVSR